MRIRTQIEHLEQALAPLLALGWRIARIEVCYDDGEGEFINLRLTYEPPASHGEIL